MTGSLESEIRLTNSAETSMRVPTAMIFVPSKDGISHNPNEYTSKEEW